MRGEAVFEVGAAALLSGLLVGTVRRYTLRRAILDLPNARSSHSVAIPRGGGLGMLAAVLVVFVLTMGRQPGIPLCLAVVGGMLTSIIGWLDDRRSLRVRTRLAAHVVSGLLLLPLALSLDRVPAVPEGLAALWWIFWVVSAINVVNFMDGIDGMIGAQALIFGLHLTAQGGSGGPAALLGLALAGAAAGFLFWNWSPARVFLGDAGSGAVGVLFALGGILILREQPVGLLGAYLPLYFLFLDATLTLLRRAKRGERLLEPHRAHLYQRLANGSWGHAPVSLLYAALAAAGAGVASASAGPWWYGLYFALGLAVWLVLDRAFPVPASTQGPTE